MTTMSEARHPVPTRTVSQKAAASSNGRGGPIADRTPLPSLWMSIVVERACTEIWKAWDDKRDVVELRVNPAVYQAVALARPGEVSRGYPLMLLGLELISDDAVQIYEPVVVRG
jgi:hypothetical protein